MPELPEVQTIVEDLKKKIIARKIIGVWLDAPKIIKNKKPDELKKEIKGLKIIDIQRRGKNILINLTNDYLLLVHQKMTGHLLIGKWLIKRVSGRKFQAVSLLNGPLREKVNNYIHLIFYFDDGRQMALSDLRKFAKVVFGLKKEIENLPELIKLGPEPLEKSFDFSIFQSVISSKNGKIKQVLMNQEVIAGIGNIYSDEILWQAKIHPFRIAGKLKNKELKNIYSAMKNILKKAVKLRGTSISDFRDTAGKTGGYADIRKVYKKEGDKCLRCATAIKRVKIGGRSAHYCPKCQKI